MRVKQEAIVKKATKCGFSKEQVDALSRSDLRMDYIKYMYDYMSAQNNYGVDKNKSAQEANRCVDFITHKQNNKRLTSVKAQELMRYILPRDMQDNLIGTDSKNRIYHAMKMRDKYESEHDVLPFGSEADSAFSLYVFLLRKKLDNRLIRKLFKKMTSDNTTVDRTARAFDRYPCMLDDFIHNGMDSLIFFLFKRDLVCYFEPDINAMERMYNYDTHRFTFTEDEFDTYFIQCEGWGKMYVDNSLGIAELNKDKYPFIDHMVSFCRDNQMRIDNEWSKSETFNTWYGSALKDQTQIEKLGQCYQLLGRSFDIDMPAWTISIKVQTSFFVSIVYREYRSIHVNGDQRRDGWCPHDESYNATILIAPDGKIFRRHDNNCKARTIPLTVSEALLFINKDNMLGDVFKHVISYYIKKNRFVNDVIEDCKEAGCLMPITFNDVIACHNRAHFLKTKYKLANSLQVNWNKKNLNVSYMILKAYPKIEPGIGQRILLQQKDLALLPDGYEYRDVKSKVLTFVANLINHLVIEAETKAQQQKVGSAISTYKQEIADEVQTAILEDEMDMWIDDRLTQALDLFDIKRQVDDYVRMCLLSKKKIRIDIRSVRQINNLHDRAAHGDDETYYRKNTSNVTIPKHSKFKHLRDILPMDFEWIQSRKRLILETELQHHCVWSYADKITDDRCAIYSFVDVNAEHTQDGKAKRYTIEFDVNSDGKYSIVQVQGKYDRAHTTKMRDYIQSILDEKQKEPDGSAA